MPRLKKEEKETVGKFGKMWLDKVRQKDKEHNEEMEVRAKNWGSLDNFIGRQFI